MQLTVVTVVADFLEDEDAFVGDLPRNVHCGENSPASGRQSLQQPTDQDPGLDRIVPTAAEWAALQIQLHRPVVFADAWWL